MIYLHKITKKVFLVRKKIWDSVYKLMGKSTDPTIGNTREVGNINCLEEYDTLHEILKQKISSVSLIFLCATILKYFKIMHDNSWNNIPEQ